MFKVFETREYIDRFLTQNEKQQAQIQARIARIRVDGYFGVAKKLDTRIAELKWRNGRRIYFARTMDQLGNIVILLIGGNKNSQRQDIVKAKLILKKLTEDK